MISAQGGCPIYIDTTGHKSDQTGSWSPGFKYGLKNIVRQDQEVSLVVVVGRNLLNYMWSDFVCNTCAYHLQSLTLISFRQALRIRMHRADIAWHVVSPKKEAIFPRRQSCSHMSPDTGGTTHWTTIRPFLYFDVCQVGNRPELPVLCHMYELPRLDTCILPEIQNVPATSVIFANLHVPGWNPFA